MPDEPISPPLAKWKFFGMEDGNRRARHQMPNLRLANTARRHLAAVVEYFSAQTSTGWQTLADLSVADAHRLTMSQLGVLGVRTSSSAIVLVTSGYAVDAAAHLRRLVECTLRGRAALADRSGEHARRWLSGRPRPSAEKLAQKFGAPEELRMLSITAHADARGMALMHAPDLSGDGIPTVPLFPHRDPRWERVLLYGVAYESVMLAAGLAEAFDTPVRIPTWLGTELKAVGDELRAGTSERVAPTDTRTAPPNG